MMSAVIDQAAEQAKEIERKTHEFFTTVNDVLDWVPPPFEHLIEPIQQGMANLRKKNQEFWDRVNEFFTNQGNPEKLRGFAEEWQQEIGNRIGEIASTIELVDMRSNIEWEGRAAEGYKVIVPEQGEGLEKLKSLAIQHSTSLKKLGDGIEDFWTALGLAFGAFALAIGAALLSAASIVGIPVAIGAVLGAAATALNLIITAVTERDALEDTIRAEQDTIAQGTHDLGSTWTRSKTNMANPDDWEPR